MTIKELLEAQAELDRTIIEVQNLQDLDPKIRLANTLLALQVEVSELANETRAFKFWSRKEPAPREVILDEFADVIHFTMSLANQFGFSEDDIKKAYYGKHEVNYKRQNVGY